MKGRIFGRGLFRLFFTLVGVGAGALVGEKLHPILVNHYAALGSLRFSRTLVMLICAILIGLVFFALSYTIAIGFLNLVNRSARSIDEMTTKEIGLSIIGLVAGLSVAALCSILVLAAGPTLLTISVCALMYVALGYTGLFLAQRRFRKRKGKKGPSRLERLADELGEDEPEGDAFPPKLIDSSVLIDGRLEAVLKCGFLEGELYIPEFVLMELQKLADSAEEEKRALGKRGLERAERLCAECGVMKLEEQSKEEVDIALLKLCRQKGYALLTNDQNLMRLCAVDAVRTLSITALADALKPPMAAGDSITVAIRKKGKEAGQGVGYLEDGTMVVMENADDAIGQNISGEVKQVRGTAAGRIIFARRVSE